MISYRHLCGFRSINFSFLGSETYSSHGARMLKKITSLHYITLRYITGLSQ
jgi:hypothetical protein